MDDTVQRRRQWISLPTQLNVILAHGRKNYIVPLGCWCIKSREKLWKVDSVWGRKQRVKSWPTQLNVILSWGRKNYTVLLEYWCIKRVGEGEWYSARKTVNKESSHTKWCLMEGKLNCTWMLMYKEFREKLFMIWSYIHDAYAKICDLWYYLGLSTNNASQTDFLLMHVVLRTSNAKMWRLYIVLQNAQNIFVWLYHLFHCILYCQVLVIELITFCTKLKFI